MVDLSKTFTGCVENDERLAELTYVDTSDVCASVGRRKDRGLFAKDVIKAGTLIGEYTGMITTRRKVNDSKDPNYSEINQNYVKWLSYVDSSDPVFMELKDQKTGEVTIIDNKIGIDGHNLLRYANHSRNDANMDTKDEFFYAARDIQPGEELTWCYGDYDFEPEQPLIKIPEWLKFWKPKDTSSTPVETPNTLA